MAAAMRIKTQACCVYRISSVIIRKTTKSLLFWRCTSSSIIPRETDIDPVAMEIMEKKGVTFKGHPGKMALKAINMPERLERAVEAVLRKYPIPNLSQKSEQLNNYLHSRHAPAEEHHLQMSAKKIYDSILERDNVDLSSMGEDEREKYEATVKGKVLNKLRATQYHWKPMNFDAPTAMIYLRARLAYNYSTFLQCFSEIHRREPDFYPRAVFDLGSGLGSSIWAGNKVWGAMLFEYYCVDSSRDMNTLARLLLQDGEEQKQMHVNGVYFRQFQPSPAQNSFSLVVCGHTLLELLGQQERLETVTNLWKMTEDYLILVENGTTAGFTVINEAKEHLLKLSQEQGGKLLGHVFAPCPHDAPCPKLIERNSPCFFSVSYKPGRVLAQNESKQSSRYSYVIMRKGKRMEEAVRWPRVIQEVVRASKHVHCHLCCPNATLSHSILTQKKHGRNMYRCARYSRWGDLFPVPLSAHNVQSSNTQEVHETDNSKCVQYDKREGNKSSENCQTNPETPKSRENEDTHDSEHPPPNHNPAML